MAVLYTNNATSALAASITNVATSFSVTAGHGARFPTITGSDYFYVTLVDSGGNIEIVKVTARSTDTFTVVRGQDGTTARAYSGGDKVESRITKAMLDDFKSDARSGLASASTDVTPPASPNDGDLWWDSTAGQLKIWYVDANGGQWVDAAQGVVGPQGPAGADGADGADGAPGGVASVNGQTGTVTLSAASVGAATAAQGTNADTAFGWGDHAAQGYATPNDIALITGDMLGFIDRTSTTLAFNEGTRTFTITPTGATWSVYYRGDLLTVTGAKSVVIPNTTGAYFVRLNPTTLVLESYGPIPDFANDVIMAYIYWNATTSKALIVGDERHGSKRDTTWHSNQHLNLGTVWRSGGSLSYTLDTAASIQIGVGTPLLIADEDMVHTITHSATPAADYEQVLTTAASLEVLYLSGTEYVSTTASTTPWVAGTTTARYNPVVSSSGSLADAGEGKYITYWLLATNDIRRPVKLVMGRTAWDSIDAAYSEAFENYSLNFAEQVFMYQIVLRTSTSYANTPKVVIAAVRKILDRVPSSSSGYSAGDHGALTGRDAADQHPIGSIINLQSSLDAKQDTLVSGTNIKTVNGTTLLGSGDLAVSASITNTEAALSADVQMPTSGTWYNGPSVSLAAGTWLVTGHITFWRTATTATTWFGRISDGTNHHASGQMYTASLAGIGGVMTLTTTVTLAATTTIRLQGTTSAGNAACLMKAATTANGSGNNATQITAIRLA